MNRLRARLFAWAIAILACQGAAMAAVPVALCRGVLAADADLDECCKDLGPGQTCPMHHKTHDASKPRGSAWTCPCSPSEVVLVSLVGVSGALPAPIRIAAVTARVTFLVTLSPAPLEHQQLPSCPPPRISSDLRLV